MKGLKGQRFKCLCGDRLPMWIGLKDEAPYWLKVIMELRASYCGELNSQSLNAMKDYRMGSGSIINSLTDSSNIER